MTPSVIDLDFFCAVVMPAVSLAPRHLVFWVLATIIDF